MKLSDIKANTNNPRLIKDDKFKKLVESVKSFPEMLQLRPIVVNKDMIILWGNMRYKACKEAWMKEIPVIVADNLTEEQEREFLIKDNVSGGEWDWDILANEWDKEELTEWWLDVQFETVEPEAEEDDFEVDEWIKTDIVLWDLFEIWPHRLLCWDSTNIDYVNKLMNGEKADMVFTDPPYGIAYDNTERWKNVKKQSESAKKGKWEMIMWDETDFDPSCVLEYFSYCKEIFIWWMQYYPQILWRWWAIVWNRKSQEMEDCPFADFELCWSKQERNRMFWIKWGGFISKEKWEERLHTTQKPVSLATAFINEWGKKADIIADVFWWSGSTMVACHQLNRKCYMSELDPKYVQTIINRMMKLDSTLEIKRNWQPYLIG